jgi:small subunit ribosomal protein S16
MLMIRLARFGKKKQPFYRVVVSENKHTPRGRKVEYVGSYNPKSKELVLDSERVKYWISQGVGYSRTVGMMLLKQGFLQKENMPREYFEDKKRPNKKEAKAQAAAKPAGGAPAVEASAATESPASPTTESAPATEEKVTEQPAAEAKKEEPKEDAVA